MCRIEETSIIANGIQVFPWDNWVFSRSQNMNWDKARFGLFSELNVQFCQKFNFSQLCSDTSLILLTKIYSYAYEPWRNPKFKAISISPLVTFDNAFFIAFHGQTFAPFAIKPLQMCGPAQCTCIKVCWTFRIRLS